MLCLFSPHPSCFIPSRTRVTVVAVSSRPIIREDGKGTDSAVVTNAVPDDDQLVTCDRKVVSWHALLPEGALC